VGSDVRWTVRDREGNEIYLTQERWEHITAPANHPEMGGFEVELKQTIQRSRRKQDPLNPQKYVYSWPFNNLHFGNTHIVVVVLFRLREQGLQKPIPNNYVVTAYQKEVG
jgi:Lhr-like helicase